LTTFVRLLPAAKWNRVDPDEPTMGAEADIFVENKVRVLYNDNTFKKNVDCQGKAMACHKDKDHVNDNEVVPKKAQ
jgi:hypothetical protein